MKKIILLFLMLISFSGYSQKVKAFVSKQSNLTFEQYDLIKLVNQYNPDILISKVATNNYWNDLKSEELIESYLNYDLPADCDSYMVLLYPDNTQLDYSYKLKSGVVRYGHINVFGGSVIRVDYEVSPNSKLTHIYKVNDKIINTYKN